MSAAERTDGGAVARSARSGRITCTCGFCARASSAKSIMPAAARQLILTGSEAVVDPNEKVCRLLRRRDSLRYINAGDAEIEPKTKVGAIRVKRWERARRIS